MNDELYEELSKIKDLDSRRSYSHAQLQWVYTMYTTLTGNKKNMTSCGKCNATTLKQVRRIYDQETEKRNGTK
jgi:hypothetical protein